MKCNIVPDTFVIISTVIYFAIAVLFFVASFRFPIMWLSWLIRITTIATMVLMIFFVAQMPMSFTINENEIVVKQIIGEKRFVRSEVKLTRIDGNILDNSVRSFGSGGVGGYIGWFNSPQLGKFYMIASNKNDLILIQSNTEKYVTNCPSKEGIFDN